MTQNFTEFANSIRQVPALPRGDCKQAEYGKVILPFTLLLRLDCVRGTTKGNVAKEFDKREAEGVTDIVIEGQEAHNNISPQLLKGGRIFTTINGMSAKLVRQQFKAAGSSDAR